MTKLLDDLKEGVVILDDKEDQILYTNREASKNLKIKDTGTLKYVFDRSHSLNSNPDANTSSNIQDPIFGLVEKFEPQGLDYCGFLKDMNETKAKFNLKEIIEK